MAYGIPEVGKLIEVEMGNPLPMSARYRGMPDSTVYNGTVLKSFNWINPDDFCLSTNDPESPVRILDSKLIRTIRYVDGTAPVAATVEEKPQVRVWTIEGSKGNVYTVTLNHGKFGCNCVAGQFGRHCKHVDQAKKDF